MGGLAFADEWLRSTALAKRIDAWLETYRGESMVVLRVGAGATMLMAWQAGTLLAPELPAVHEALGWAQFGVVLLLLIPHTVPAAGVLLGVLWLYAAFSFGLFHLLDYSFYPGIAFALTVSRSEDGKDAGLRLPRAAYRHSRLFAVLGRAREARLPRVGPVRTLTSPRARDRGSRSTSSSSARRSSSSPSGICSSSVCSAVRSRSPITVVFLITSSVFGGKLEVMGHTPVHAALVVFLLEGAGHSFPDHRSSLRRGSRRARSSRRRPALRSSPSCSSPTRQARTTSTRRRLTERLGPADRARPVDSARQSDTGPHEHRGAPHDHGDHDHQH